ncbi:MAG: hypothetical protein WDZ77_02100 [Candidatus Pacearchaeota archaeon]
MGMKEILLICNEGKTRSKYLAGCLKKKEDPTRMGGASKSAKVKLIQNKIDWTDRIVVTDGSVLKKLRDRYNLPKKEGIKINVSDNFQYYPKAKEILDKYAKLRKKFLEKHVHPNLRKQINKKLN